MQLGRIYQPPAPIRPARTKPVYLSVLRPTAGASTIPLGEASPHLLAVERRVGRGRITMLTINPTEPVLAALAGPRHAGPPRRPPPARGGRRRAGRHRRRRTTRGRAAACLAGPGPDLVPDHQPRRPARRGLRRPPARSRPDAGPRPRSRGPQSERAAAPGGGRADPRRPGVADWRDTVAVPHPQPRPARGGVRHHDPQLELRAQGDPRLPDRRRPAQLADLPLRPQSSRVGLDRRPAGRLRLRHRRAAGRRLRHGLRLGLRRDRPAGGPGRLSPGPPHAGSPRSTRPAGGITRSPIRTTRPRWRCRWTTAGRSAART